MKRQGIITLLTDFGLKDVYVSAMKAVILTIVPSVFLVDISHGISRHSIRQGAFLLSLVSSYFPKGTIHLVVIDPGVGTSRRRIAIKGKRYLYVGPDNGVLLPAAKKDGIEKVVEIKSARFILPNASTSFEGRDIFAPVAAYLVNSVPLEELGPEIYNPIDLRILEPDVTGDRIVGLVFHIDWFGNLITNLPKRLLKTLNVSAGGFFEVIVGTVAKTMRFCSVYAEVPTNAPLLIMSSGGFLEVSVNQGSARSLFNAVIESNVTLIIHPKQ
ncbi:MAG: SAM hydrolase/SAM-dependent halogenase family protein [Candidatus Hermodarchaeia archaeon]